MECLYKIIRDAVFTPTGLGFASEIYLEQRISKHKISLALATEVCFIPFVQSVTHKSPNQPEGTGVKGPGSVSLWALRATRVMAAC